MNWRNESEDTLRDLLCPAENPQILPEVDQRLRARLEDFRQQLDAQEARVEGARKARPALHRWIRAVAFGAAAAILIVVMWRLTVSGDAWAEVLESVKGRPWVHCAGEMQDGKSIEVWISLPRRIVASRVGELVSYADLDLRVSFLYRPEKKQLYRTPVEQSAGETFGHYQALFAAFGRGDDKLTLPDSEMRLIEQKRRDVDDGGRKWREYELVFGLQGASGVLTTVFRVDPGTGLPRSCRLTPPEGLGEIQLTIDYPGTGPEDVYALGVPKTVELVDRVPSGDLERILDGLKIGRRRMDPYIGLIVETGAQDDWWDARSVYRVWRSGAKWRIERAFFPDVTRLRKQLESGQVSRPGDGEDPLAWWKKTAERLRFEPVLLSDGKKAYRFNVRYNKEVILPDDDPDQLSFHVESIQRDKVRLDRDDPRPSLIVLPEFRAYPVLHSPSLYAKTSLDAEPKIGPAGTVLVTIAHEGRDSKVRYRRRAWLDPRRDYVAMRFGLRSADDDGRPVMVHAIDELARSPSGHWYPTAISRGAADAPGAELRRVSVERYYLDFQAPIPESLFARSAQIVDPPVARAARPRSAEQTAQRQRSFKNLRQLARAMHAYHDANKKFPPAIGLGPNGTTPHSWRVALLPFLDQKELYDRYRLDEPWDSPANRKVLEAMPDVFHAGGNAKTTTASYFALVGDTTVFPHQQSTSFVDIRDGSSNTLLLVEARREIPWTMPEDVPYDPQKPFPQLGGFDEAGYHVAFVDGSVRFLEEVDEQTLRALISRSGRERVLLFK